MPTVPWPRSEAASVVRRALEAKGQAKAADLAAEVQAELAALGVAHPGSLISRLKQAGLIREATS